MKSTLLEYLRNILANVPSIEEIWPELVKAAPKPIEQILVALLMGLLFLLAVRLRKRQAIREDGWYYLTPGLISWFTLICSSLISLGTLAGGAIALRTGYYKPTFDGDGLVKVGMFAFFILGFGAMARLCSVFFFSHKVRWNHIFIEKISGQRVTMRIARKDVREILQKKGADHLWIVSDKARIKVWTHMNGVEQLISAIDGNGEAFGLMRQSKPFMESKPRPDYAGSFDPHER